MSDFAKFCPKCYAFFSDPDLFANAHNAMMRRLLSRIQSIIGSRVGIGASKTPAAIRFAKRVRDVLGR